MWTVLIGPNGTCKTSILQAIGMAASGKSRAESLVKNRASLLPQVRTIELRGNAGVRRASQLIESHRFEFDVGSESLRVPAIWLSQGYQATIAWIADLVGQVFWESGQPTEPQDMEGLVLIDELDLHLHPSWQLVLIPALKASFPRMQFVATTHSPMLLTGLREDEIIRLEQDGDGNIVPTTESGSPALMTGTDLYRHYVGFLDLIPNPLGQKAWDYARLAGNPYRTDEDDERMWTLARELEDAGMAPGPSPVPRKGLE